MEVKDSNDIAGGKGLFATKNYSQGEIIHTLTGEILNYPTRETIHIGNNKHIYDEYGIYINHSFEPNIIICENNIIALNNIQSGDEIKFNYNDSEINMANPFYVDNILVCGK